MKAIDRNKGQMWVDALLSGEYTQTTGHFVAASMDGSERIGHCCLAVLTDIAIKNGCDTVRWGPGDSVEVLLPHDHDNLPYCNVIDSDVEGVWVEYQDGDLPPQVAEWAGIVDDNAANPELNERRAIERNDSDDDDFQQIAQAILDDPAMRP